MAGILDFVQKIINTAIAFIQQIQGRHVGWLTFNRKTGDFTREQQPLFKKLKLLLLFNPLTEWIDRTHLLRLWTHERNIREGAISPPG
jgi:phosphatidylserine decarboxylase